MRYYKACVASLCGLLLIGSSAWAEDAPVVDLNTLPDESSAVSAAAPLLAQEEDAVSASSSASMAVAARQSLPMDQRIRLLEQQINNFTQMNLPAKVDNLEQQIHQLNGQLEEQAHTIESLSQQKQALQEEIANTHSTAPTLAADSQAKQNPTSPQSTEPAAQAKNASSAVKEKESVAAEGDSSTSSISAAQTAVVQNKRVAATPTASAAVTTTDEQAYQAAFNLMVKKQNTASITAFQAFIKNYPNSKVYLPSAHYWLGELYSTNNKSTLAAKEFNIVIKQYSTHAKVPDAMLKLAIIHDDAGQHDQAKQELQKVVQQYPTSTAAKLAKMRLQTIG